MHKCFLLLVFMVIILPSLGLSRYNYSSSTDSKNIISAFIYICVRSYIHFFIVVCHALCSLDLFFTWLFDVNFLDEKDVKFQYDYFFSTFHFKKEYYAS